MNSAKDTPVSARGVNIKQNPENPNRIEKTRVVTSRQQNRPNSGYSNHEPTLRNVSSMGHFTSEYRQSFSREGSRR